MRRLILIFICAIIFRPSFTLEEDEDDTQQQQQVEDAEILGFGQNAADPCLAPKKSGPCKAQIPRYYYNKKHGSCEPFLYGGCGGNENNFETFANCQKTCKKVEKNVENICTLPPSKGPGCDGFLIRYTYNSTMGQCVRYVYEGCGATANNFVTRADCEQKCGGPMRLRNGNQKNPCKLPKDPGFCYGYNQRFFFDPKKGRCETFIYGGCQGNGNNFPSAQECQNTCGGEQPNTNIECASVDCPWNLYSHYTQLKCKPIYDGDSCCPTRFDCPDARTLPVVESQRREVMCHYKGKDYRVGENIESADVGCRSGCVCGKEGNKGKIQCASVDCFGNFQAGCFPLYENVSHCCPTSTYCPNNAVENGNETETTTVVPIHKCMFEDEEYVEGQLIYPKNTCTRCLCTKDFNGTIETETCEKIDCGLEIHYADQLEKDCTPVYHIGENGPSCCPISWRCPEVDDTQTPMKMKSTEVRTSAVCQEEQHIGICSGSRPRYFYNNETKKCEYFTYTGCGGNGNNFENIGDCRELCEVQEMPGLKWRLKGNLVGNQVPEERSQNVTRRDECVEPPRTGRCKGFFTRYFYSPQENNCKAFIYGGCGGSKNNFYSMESCQASCAQSTSDVTPEILPVGGGRAINERLQDDICKLPSMTGLCKGHIQRFHFDPTTKTCKPFVYGGCGGNANNFFGIEQCEMKCLGGNSNANILAPNMNPRWRSAIQADDEEIVPLPEQCKLPKKSGPCYGYFEKYYFDVTSGTCQKFLFGGCMGNANKFNSFAECQNSCRNLKIDRSDSPDPKASLCDKPVTECDDSSMTMNIKYYYDSSTGRCAPSTCPGNFNSESECLSTCKQPTIESLTNQGLLYCTFGKLTIPVGSAVQPKNKTMRNKCGETICTCITPPTLTCTLTTCPPDISFCPELHCHSNCKQTVEINGCKKCDCPEDLESAHPGETETVNKNQLKAQGGVKNPNKQNCPPEPECAPNCFRATNREGCKYCNCGPQIQPYPPTPPRQGREDVVNCVFRICNEKCTPVYSANGCITDCNCNKPNSSDLIFCTQRFCAPGERTIYDDNGCVKDCAILGNPMCTMRMCNPGEKTIYDKNGCVQDCQILENPSVVCIFRICNDGEETIYDKNGCIQDCVPSTNSGTNCPQRMCAPGERAVYDKNGCVQDCAILENPSCTMRLCSPGEKTIYDKFGCIQECQILENPSAVCTMRFCNPGEKTIYDKNGCVQDCAILENPSCTMRICNPGEKTIYDKNGCVQDCEILKNPNVICLLRICEPGEKTIYDKNGCVQDCISETTRSESPVSCIFRICNPGETTIYDKNGCVEDCFSTPNLNFACTFRICNIGEKTLYDKNGCVQECIPDNPNVACIFRICNEGEETIYNKDGCIQDCVPATPGTCAQRICDSGCRPVTGKTGCVEDCDCMQKLIPPRPTTLGFVPCLLRICEPGCRPVINKLGCTVDCNCKGFGGRGYNACPARACDEGCKPVKDRQGCIEDCDCSQAPDEERGIGCILRVCDSGCSPVVDKNGCTTDCTCSNKRNQNVVCPLRICEPGCREVLNKDGCIQDCDCSPVCVQKICEPLCREKMNANGCIDCDCPIKEPEIGSACVLMTCPNSCNDIQDAYGCVIGCNCTGSSSTNFGCINRQCESSCTEMKDVNGCVFDCNCPQKVQGTKQQPRCAHTKKSLKCHWSCRKEIGMDGCPFCDDCAEF